MTSITPSSATAVATDVSRSASPDSVCGDDYTSLTKLNINVGILGHVDSGKTSLARALSTHFSTASIDKSSQEKERGITIDLGFSSFCVSVDSEDITQSLRNKLRLKYPNITEIQFTLVDCPGHASLIRTIIGGAQIIDFMLLVINVNKGIETQTAECLVLAEILLKKKSQILVVLNKMDLFYAKYNINNNGINTTNTTSKSKSKSRSQPKLEKKMHSIRKVFKRTKFGKRVKMVCVSANKGGTKAPGIDTEFDHNLNDIASKTDGMQALIGVLLSQIECEIPDRIQQSREPFLAAVDHCFGIQGQGTILTCTILQGSLRVQQMIEIASYKELRKVRSLQMFSKPVSKAIAGDRVSCSISQFSHKKLNRGIICAPNFMSNMVFRAIARVDPIRFFKERIKSKMKFHITIGYTTTVATVYCFRRATAFETRQQSSRSTYYESHKEKKRLFKLKQKQRLLEQQQQQQQQRMSGNNNNNGNANDTDSKSADSNPTVSKKKPKAKKSKMSAQNSVGKNNNNNNNGSGFIAAIDWTQAFDYALDYLHLDELSTFDPEAIADSADAKEAENNNNNNSNNSNSNNSNNSDTTDTNNTWEQYVLLSFAKPICATENSLLIGSRFDNQSLRMDVCRLAFYGKLVSIVGKENIMSYALFQQQQQLQNIAAENVNQNTNNNSNNSANVSKKQLSKKAKSASNVKLDVELQNLRIYKSKEREGHICKFVDDYNVVIADMFDNPSSVQAFIALNIEVKYTRNVGAITSAFGDNSGKFYAKFEHPLFRRDNPNFKPKVVLKWKKMTFQKGTHVVQ